MVVYGAALGWIASLATVASLPAAQTDAMGGHRWDGENVCVGAFSFFVCVEDLHTIGEIAWLAAAEKKGIRVVLCI